MKKTLPLHDSVKAPARVLDQIKHEVRKYVRREHKKDLPDGYDLWEFDCKVGATDASAEACALGDINAKIDQVAASGAEKVYIEVVARAVKRSISSETPAT